MCKHCGYKVQNVNLKTGLLYYRDTSSVVSTAFVLSERVFSSADFHEDESQKKEMCTLVGSGDKYSLGAKALVKVSDLDDVLYNYGTKATGFPVDFC